MSASITAQDTDLSLAIQQCIHDYFEKGVQKATWISPYYAQLWREMARLVNTGGKRLRPKMTVLAYRAFGGDEVDAILPVAVAQELLHAGVLMHDDIIDRDYSRYGVPNIAGAYQKLYEPQVASETERLHYAHSAALLGGDLLISGAYQMMLESEVEPALIIEVQKFLAKSIFEVVGGELIDTESSFRALGDIPAETVAFYKTASYSFIGPLLVGAVLADASHEDQAYLRLFAENLGIAFQLRDDIMGVFGDEAETGKTTTGDLREGKHTYMVEQFYAFASDEEKAAFEVHFGKADISDEGIAALKELLETARQKTEEAIARFEVKAHSALESLSLKPEHDEQFRHLISLSLRRTK